MYILIYDDNCPLCIGAAERIRARDRAGAVTLVGLTEIQLVDLPGAMPPVEQLREAMHLVSETGEVWSGAEAVSELAMVLPRWSWLGRVLRWPGVRTAARWGYGLVAKRRDRLR